MDSLINAAARALATGDPLAALKRVALRDDPPALALRGIAMAQLGDFAIARALLQRAGRAFGPREAVARARCIVAEAEIALVSRDLGWPVRSLDAARATLEAGGDRINAAHARNLAVRRLILTGSLEDAARMIAAAEPGPLPPATEAMRLLSVAGLAIRRIDSRTAQAALDRAVKAAHAAGIPALVAEVKAAAAILHAPATRIVDRAGERLLTLAEVEALLAAPILVIDGYRHAVRAGGDAVPLATRPVLFALARILGEAWPDDVHRAELIRRAFRGRDADASHRARLRVEIGRLREVLRPLGMVEATRDGYRLIADEGRSVSVLAPALDTPHGSVLALLSDGEAWSSSALAIALGSSPRTVQRALERLAAAGEIRAIGRGPARRWLSPPVPGFPTGLLLPGPLPGG